MHRLRGRRGTWVEHFVVSPKIWRHHVAFPPGPRIREEGGGGDFLHIASALHKCMLFMQHFRRSYSPFFLSFAVSILFFFAFSLYRYYLLPPLILFSLSMRTNIPVQNLFFRIYLLKYKRFQKFVYIFSVNRR